MLTLVTVAWSATHGAKIYINPEQGYGSYIAAAMINKKVPAVLTTSREEADYELISVVQVKEETTGSKIARCIFMYCIGVAGTQNASVQLIDIKTGNIVWAYNVGKYGAQTYQSTSESIAKHLKGYLESH